MTVVVKLVSGAKFEYFDVDDILENDEFVQVILDEGSISFPMARIEWWEVGH